MQCGQRVVSYCLFLYLQEISTWAAMTTQGVISCPRNDSQYWLNGAWGYVSSLGLSGKAWKNQSSGQIPQVMVP